MYELRVGGQVRKLVNAETPGDAAQDSWAFVVREVVPRTDPQLRENVAQSVQLPIGRLLWRVGDADTLKLFTISDDLRRNLRCVEDIVNQTRGQRVARHVVILRLARVLHDTETAHLLDAFHAHGAIRARTGKHDRHGARAMRLGERAEENIDWSAPHLVPRHVPDLDVAVLDLQGLVGWNHVNVIGLNTDASFDLGHRKQGRGLKHLRELAVVIRREVQNYDVGHVRMSGHVREEIPERLYATGLRAERILVGSFVHVLTLLLTVPLKTSDRKLVLARPA